MKVPERNRIMGDTSYGNNGVFLIDHNKITGYCYNVQASDGMDWEHVSVTLQDHRGKRAKPVKRCPTWAEMCYIKSIFWEDEETVMQLHPPKSEWVSTHPYCLHLWKPVKEVIVRPPAILVGNKGDNIQKLK